MVFTETKSETALSALFKVNKSAIVRDYGHWWNLIKILSLRSAMDKTSAVSGNGAVKTA